MNPSPMLLLPGEPLPLPGSGGREEKGKVGAPDLSEAGEGCPESVCVSLPLSQSLSGSWMLSHHLLLRLLPQGRARVEDKLIPEEKKKVKKVIVMTCFFIFLKVTI